MNAQVEVSIQDLIDRKIDSACAMDKEIKKLKAKLDPLKEELLNHIGEGGSLTSASGNVVKVGKASERFSVPDVMQALELIKEKDIPKLVKITGSAFLAAYPKAANLVVSKFSKCAVYFNK